MLQFYYSLFFLFAGLIYFSIGLISFLGDKKHRGRRAFFLLCLIHTAWAVVASLMNSSLTGSQAAMYRNLGTLCFLWIYPMRVIFVLRMSNYCDKITSRIGSYLLFLPALLATIYFVNMPPFGTETMHKISEGWTYRGDYNRWSIDSYLAIYSWIFLSITLILVVVLNFTKDNLHREKSAYRFLMFGVLVTLFFGGVSNQIVLIGRLKYSPPLGIIFNVISTVLINIFIEKYEFMNLNMTTVLKDILEEVEDGVLVIDLNRRIRYINRGAKQLMGIPEDLADRHPVLEEVFPLQELDRPEEESIKNHVQLKRMDGEVREIMLSFSDVLDENADPFGGVYMMKDITELVQKQRELVMAKATLEEQVKDRTQKLEEEIEIRKKGELELRFMAYYDQGTGLYNRQSIFEKANKILNQSLAKQGQGQPLEQHALLFIDLNRFKAVNDNYGHAEGDRLLVEVAQRLQRVFDSHAMVARFGGDEFLVFIEKADDKTVQALLEKLELEIQKPYEIEGANYDISLSYGVSLFPKEGVNLDRLIQRADAKMYQNKEIQKQEFMGSNIRYRQ